MEQITGKRPRVALVAFGIEERNAVPRVSAEQIKRLHSEVDFVVVSHRLGPALRPLVAEWRRVPALTRSARLRQATFFVAAPLRLWRANVDLVHSALMLVPSRVDLASIHWCYAAFDQALRGAEARSEVVPRLFRRVGAAVERWCYTRRARALGAVSRRSQTEYERLFPGARVELIPNGVDPERFRPDDRKREEIRAREGVAPREIVVLFVGGAWRYKGLAIAIEGFARASETADCAIRLWVVGAGDRAPFERLATGLGVADRIRFFGFLNDVAPFYQGADIFLLPSLHEEFPNVALEAGASGLPIVATPCNGIEELVGADEAGILVERSADSVSSALTKLIDDPSLRARMGAAGRRRAKQYTWDRSAANLLAVYRRLLSDRSA